MLYKVSSLGRQIDGELSRHSSAHGPKIWCQIGVKVRRLGRFSRFSRLITSVPSITYVLTVPWHGRSQLPKCTHTARNRSQKRLTSAREQYAQYPASKQPY